MNLDKQARLADIQRIFNKWDHFAYRIISMVYSYSKPDYQSQFCPLLSENDILSEIDFFKLIFSTFSYNIKHYHTWGSYKEVTRTELNKQTLGEYKETYNSLS